VIGVVHRGIMAFAGLGRDGPVIQLEHELLAIDIVDPDPGLPEPESRDDRE
jgi:hypothetical protein